MMMKYLFMTKTMENLVKILVVAITLYLIWLMSRKRSKNVSRAQQDRHTLSAVRKDISALVKQGRPLMQVHSSLSKMFKDADASGCSDAVLKYIFEEQAKIENLFADRNEKAIELFKAGSKAEVNEAIKLLELNVQDECDTSYSYQKLLSVYCDDRESLSRIYWKAKDNLVSVEDERWFQNAKRKIENES